MRKIAVIGTGYVGLVSGVCLSEFGWNVTCMDIDQDKISCLKAGKIPIYEPGLEDMLKKNAAAGRILFTDRLKDAIDGADVVFIAVGTPPTEDGSADLSYVFDAASAVAENMEGYKLIVDKSTVPIGTAQKVKTTIAETLMRRGVDFGFDVVANPEFLREGEAVTDFMHPARVVVGCESDHAFEMMKTVYRVLFLNNHPFIRTNLETAELIKYAANAFLATKITFINEMANLCEAVGANVKKVSYAMGLDSRIGGAFLNAGAGFGGSCFPKDTRAIASVGAEFGVDLRLVNAVIDANDAQKLKMAGKIETALEGVRGKTVAFLGLAFKPGTDDVREAPAIAVINVLLRAGAKIRVYDPVAMENARRYALGDKVSYAQDEYDAAKGADALALITEWNRFRALDFDRLGLLMRQRNFFDLRNVYDRGDIETKKFNYYGVGL